MWKFFGFALALSTLVATPALAADSTSLAPGRILFGVIIAYVCISRQHKDIGGWLLYYYIQLYLSVVSSLVLFIPTYRNYLPIEWGGETKLYLLFLASTVPGLLIAPTELVFAERLRHRRCPERLQALRFVLWAHLGSSILGLLIDGLYFPENIILSILSVVWPLIWVPYFHRSTRVDRVFGTPSPELAPGGSSASSRPV